jgi:nonsense-mediated mRNA decay protein 3
LQCIVCGKDEVFLKNLCKDCFTLKHKFLKIKDKISLTICFYCSTVRIKKSWIEYSSKEEAIKATVVSFIEADGEATDLETDVALRFLDDHNVHVDINASFNEEGERVNETMSTFVNINDGVFDNCSRAVGNYYEAIIQIRASGRPLFEDEKEEVISEVVSTVGEEGGKDSSVFITKVEELKKGIDFYLSSTSTSLGLMKKLAKKYGAITKQTSKLVGRKEGRDVYRTTFLVRLPNWRPGDVVNIGGRYHVVQKMDHSKLNALDLQTRSTATFKSNQLKKVKVYRKEDVTFNAVVVSRFKDEISLLDPVTMETKVVLVPGSYADMDPEATEVTVYRIEEELLLA